MHCLFFLLSLHIQEGSRGIISYHVLYEVYLYELFSRSYHLEWVVCYTILVDQLQYVDLGVALSFAFCTCVVDSSHCIIVCRKMDMCVTDGGKNSIHARCIPDWFLVESYLWFCLRCYFGLVFSLVWVG